MKRNKITCCRWIFGMSFSIICDFLIMLIGIISEKARRTYIQMFYPQLLKEESEEENE